MSKNIYAFACLVQGETGIQGIRGVSGAQVLHTCLIPTALHCGVNVFSTQQDSFVFFKGSKRSQGPKRTGELREVLGHQQKSLNCCYFKFRNERNLENPSLDSSWKKKIKSRCCCIRHSSILASTVSPEWLMLLSDLWGWRPRWARSSGETRKARTSRPSWKYRSCGDQGCSRWSGPWWLPGTPRSTSKSRAFHKNYTAINMYTHMLLFTSAVRICTTPTDIQWWLDLFSAFSPKAAIALACPVLEYSGLHVLSLRHFQWWKW